VRNGWSAPTRKTRTAIAGLVGLLLMLGLGTAPASGEAAAPSHLTNLAHLNFLTSMVNPPKAEGHATYRQDQDPDIGVLWVYANHQSDGSYSRVGGGDYDAATNTYGQGAFDADDISRAAVAYLNAWRQFGDEQARQHAYQLLRGLTYLQTDSGPNAGNVVLWMQPDGTLNPTPTPPDQPNPSDSGSSFWLGRTIWALGTGYAAFAHNDPQFAAFLRVRLLLALSAVERQDLTNYGSWHVVDGLRWPSWLIAGGADISSEAVYGLLDYVRASGDERARRDLTQLADGIAAMRTTGWPYGALMPWSGSRSLWHSWAAEMAGSLATAGGALGRTDWVRAAVGETATFTPHLIVQGGPDNEWLPAPIYRDQIAYGADVTLRNLLATANGTHRASFRQLAGLAASWYFGNNPAGSPMYDPATGVTYDGVSVDGQINLNSGAESTIHGVMSMLALDAAPDVAARARQATVTGRVTWTYAEAESGRLSGQADVVTPADPWTGESQWSGGQYVGLGTGGQVAIPVRAPVEDRYQVLPVFDRQIAPLEAVGTRLSVGGVPAGVQEQGGAGPQGTSSVPGYLDVGQRPTSRSVPAGDTTIIADYTGDGRPARLDGVLLQPDIEWVTLGGPGGGQALLRSFASQLRHHVISLGSRPVTAYSYDAKGRLVTETKGGQGSVDAPVIAGGFTTVATN
jgi:hypothetical protein